MPALFGRRLPIWLPVIALALVGTTFEGCGGGGGGGTSSDDDDGDDDGDGGGGGGGGGTVAAGYRLLATNDLGMHCMDREFSIFSILPPFNVLRAQVTGPGADGSLDAPLERRGRRDVRGGRRRERARSTRAASGSPTSGPTRPRSSAHRWRPGRG